MKILAVCGVKNSGKTTLINRLIHYYSQQGLKVAVIKHDGHDFACDLPGTDTHSFTESGAYGTACFSSQRMFIHRVGTKENEKDLIRMFPDADLIMIEGLKDSCYPKIEIIRRAISQTPVSNRQNRFLIVTDYPSGTFDEKTAALDDLETIITCINEEVQDETY